jgi:hypothetical protein
MPVVDWSCWSFHQEEILSYKLPVSVGFIIQKANNQHHRAAQRHQPGDARTELRGLRRMR